jgi:hypothetical protein
MVFCITKFASPKFEIMQIEYIDGNLNGAVSWLIHAQIYQVNSLALPVESYLCV